jgi:hypothetical protein
MGIEFKIPSYIWKDTIDFKYKDELIDAIIFDYENYSMSNNFKFKFNKNRTSCFMKQFYDEDIPVISDKNKIFIDELSSLIKDKFNSYLKFYNIQDTFFISRMWYSLYKNGMETLPHDHYADFSGAYYLKFDNKKHNTTFFRNQNFKKQPKEEIIFEPDLNEGDVLFFPSGYPHGSKMHTDADYRILISFDILCDNFTSLIDDLESKKNNMVKYQ